MSEAALLAAALCFHADPNRERTGPAWVENYDDAIAGGLAIGDWESTLEVAVEVVAPGIARWLDETDVVGHPEAEVIRDRLIALLDRLEFDTEQLSRIANRERFAPLIMANRRLRGLR